ncbi:hypothetical protein ACJXDE_04685 [Enterococcus faecium]|uniref:hypothetical protein n=1 Tax=Enterococcus faecium TaxID=1352 RepID=UPI0038D518F4
MAGKGQPAGNIKLGISLDSTSFGNTLDEINAKVKQAESNMRANLKAYDSAGRSYEALSQKTKDLSTVMEGQNAKVRELTKRRDEAISKYGEESKQVANLNTQINNATAKYNAYSRQLNDTKKELVYSKTAVNDLSNEIKENERQMNAEVKALKAAGDESGAFEAKQKGLAKQTELSEKAIEEQRKVVKLMADEFGDSADETEDAKRALEKLERQSQISSRQLEALKSSSDQSGKKIEDFGDKSTRSARKEAIVGQKTRISITANSSALTDPSKFNKMYFTINTTSTDPFVGTVLIENIKVERGSTATEYQPNLLDAPYYLSKVALGKNIADPTVKFPIKTSNNLIYMGDMEEPFIIGETYTLTIKAAKQETQSFRVYNHGMVEYGDMTPVEGLNDVWQLTFTVSKIHKPYPSSLTIYQQPKETVGACKIDWLKIEKGNTRTPNISQFKYFGEGLKDSNNPNDYSWDVTPEYTEKGLNNTVSLTEPQSVEGLKNFEDGLQIAGKEVATVLEDTGWVNLTAINGHSWNKQGQIRRIGKLVMFRGSLKGSTLSTQDFCTIPEGFRPSNPTDNYEYQFLLPPQSSNTLDNGGMAYIRPNGVCGLPSFRGTVNLFLAPIQYYID